MLLCFFKTEKYHVVVIILMKNYEQIKSNTEIMVMISSLPNRQNVLQANGNTKVLHFYLLLLTGKLLLMQ